jgi:hypothetical protein
LTERYKGKKLKIERKAFNKLPTISIRKKMPFGE